MVIRWGVFSAKSRTALKTSWLITAGVVALYLGLIQPRDQARGIASEKASGLAALSGGVGWEPISLWRQTSASRGSINLKIRNYFRQNAQHVVCLHKVIFFSRSG
jgi:hypothetical protein